MTIISGAKAGFWCPLPDAVSEIGGTKEAMTQVGATLEYYITDRTHAMWDPDKPILIYDGTTLITPSRIDCAGGYVTLQAAPAGAVTCTIYYFSLYAIGGAYGVSADLRSETKEITTFPSELNTATAWKEYLPTLISWTMSIKRHFFLANATLTTTLATANSNLTWTAKTPGLAGNLKSIEYVSGGALGIALVGNDLTVTFVAATTTAAQIRDYVLASSTLSEVFDVSFPTGNDGTGVVGVIAHTHLANGRDYAELSKFGEKTLCVMYLNNTTGSIGKLEGVGHLTGIGPDCKLEALVESDVTLEGTGALRYHTV